MKSEAIEGNILPISILLLRYAIETERYAAIKFAWKIIAFAIGKVNIKSVELPLSIGIEREEEERKRMKEGKMNEIKRNAAIEATPRIDYNTFRAAFEHSNTIETSYFAIRLVGTKH